MTIYFYGADEVPYGCFSNFSGHGFDLDGHRWPTSEHYSRPRSSPAPATPNPSGGRRPRCGPPNWTATGPGRCAATRNASQTT
jgi:hypothetical protein